MNDKESRWNGHTKVLKGHTQIQANSNISFCLSLGCFRNQIKPMIITAKYKYRAPKINIEL